MAAPQDGAPFRRLHRGLRGCVGSSFVPGAYACGAGCQTAHNAPEKNEWERLAQLKECRVRFQVSSMRSLSWLVPGLPAEQRRAQSADASSPCTAQVAARASGSLGVRAVH